jgi:hypothetical protein
VGGGETRDKNYRLKTRRAIELRVVEMRTRNAVADRVQWSVIVPSSILALFNLVGLSFGIWMLFIVYMAPKDHHENWALGSVVLFSMYGLPLMVLLLIATILVAIFEPRLAWAYRLALMLVIAAGILADAAALAWVGMS